MSGWKSDSRYEDTNVFGEYEVKHLSVEYWGSSDLLRIQLRSLINKHVEAIYFSPQDAEHLSKTMFLYYMDYFNKYPGTIIIEELTTKLTEELSKDNT